MKGSFVLFFLLLWFFSETSSSSSSSSSFQKRYFKERKGKENNKERKIDRDLRIEREIKEEREERGEREEREERERERREWERKRRGEPLSDDLFTSDFWAPSVSLICQNHFGHTAPCVAKGLEAEFGPVVGYELQFRDFDISFPMSLLPEEQKKWIDNVFRVELAHGVAERCWPDFVRKRGRYYGQHGQILVFHNRSGPNPSYAGKSPFSRWSPFECMGRGSPHDFPSGLVGTPKAKFAIYAGTPDSQSWQHFLDRVTHVLLQVALVRPLDPEVYVVTKDPQTQSVKDIYQMLQVNRIVKNLNVIPEKLAFSCRTPLIHPYFSLKLKEIIHRNLRLKGNHPLSERKTVYYAPRIKTRIVLNEQEVLAAIRLILKERDRDEKLVVLGETPFKELVSQMHRDCAAFIGAHGGAWYNFRWCPPDSLGIEFIPSERPPVMFWEESQILQQRYHPMIIHSTRDNHVEVPINDFIEILGSNLGIPVPKFPPPLAPASRDYANATFSLYHKHSLDSLKKKGK